MGDVLTLEPGLYEPRTGRLRRPPRGSGPPGRERRRVADAVAARARPPRLARGLGSSRHGRDDLVHDFEKLGAFYLGRPVDRGDGGDCAGAAALRLARPGHPRGDRGHDRQRQDRARHRAPRGGGDRRRAGAGHRSKGDLANLLLTFPELRPGRFRALDSTWTTPAARASRSGRWRPSRRRSRGARGSPTGARTASGSARLREAAEFAHLHAGSAAGPGRSRSSPRFAAPPAALRRRRRPVPRPGRDRRHQPARPGSASTPIRCAAASTSCSRACFAAAWSAGRGSTSPTLIAEIQKPPLAKVGVHGPRVLLSRQGPLRARAAASNNLLAAPGFDVWLQGEPLDVDAPALHAGGQAAARDPLDRPPLATPERMFFVSLLLNQTLAWMRTQPGTAACAPSSTWTRSSATCRRSPNPPSKLPMLTLLKQARAFGLGVVLATQNPVDLDYKALVQHRHLVPRPPADRARQGAGARRPRGRLGAAATPSTARRSTSSSPGSAQPRLPAAQRPRRRAGASSRPAGRCPTSPAPSTASRSARWPRPRRPRARFSLAFRTKDERLP